IKKKKMPSATPLKPITGTFKRRVVRDIIIGLGAGLVGATIFDKYIYTHPRKTQEYFDKLAKQNQ
ncbi:hypothetical protein BB560_005261, partial [Smittium megazygosporum]